jgi:hypothetical protein
MPSFRRPTKIVRIWSNYILSLAVIIIGVDRGYVLTPHKILGGGVNVDWKVKSYAVTFWSNGNSRCV